MKNKVVIISVGILVILVGGIVYYKNQKEQTVGQSVVCAMDAKVCPDGSYVSRSGPKCEFAECPKTTVVVNNGEGKLEGSVTVGPVCPASFAEQYPTFSCTPTPEMYAAAKVFVYKMDKTTLVQTISPDKNGKFSVTLKEGQYFIDMIHQKIGGTKGVPTTVIISKDKPVILKLEVDTGLR